MLQIFHLKQFGLQKKRYPLINLKVQNILNSKFDQRKYDLVVVSQLLWYVLNDLSKVFDILSDISVSGGIIIFIQTFYNPKTQQQGNEIMEKVDDIISLFPFKVNKIVDFRNYKNNNQIDTELVILCKNN